MTQMSKTRRIDLFEIRRLKKQNAELLDACKLALVELDRIGSDIGFEPDRYRERIKALDALSRVVRKVGE